MTALAEMGQLAQVTWGWCERRVAKLLISFLDGTSWKMKDFTSRAIYHLGNKKWHCLLPKH